jgi:fatty acid desaturase
VARAVVPPMVARAVVPPMAAAAAIIGPVAPMLPVVVVVVAVVVVMVCVVLLMVTGGIISAVTRLADAHSADHQCPGRSDEPDKA